ncbi:aminotransferase class I/II-fold pyridoxal phosphate-dependent enzyme [Nakamurella alba]|uniref:aminotransferase class I/II-fold pyridoxal phosphate-dependent enzyme n=1 Tax=Nakamurella alba TaxID=2665158 RepID=UPI002AC34628|nr:hypothetical protein [Nakamurella alba]
MTDSAVPPPDPVLADAPLLAAWASFRGTHRPFTIPGHQGLAGRLSRALGALLDADVPLYGGLDTVKLSGGLLAAAEARAARLWGVDLCRFSVGGSTHGNQAAVLTVAGPGETVLVGRNAHRSVLLGLVAAGARPVWLPVAAHPATALPVGVTTAVLADALAAHPETRAVLLTEPAYLGALSDVPAAAELAHAAGIPLVVDQAWGAHLGVAPGYPAHALAAGADIMVTSAHKTLPAYSQAALVLARSGRIDPDRFERAFEAGHTTSPAGAVLAGIDGARSVLETVGASLLTDLAATVAAARDRLRAIDGVRVPGPEDFPAGQFDPAKLVVQLAGCGADGIAVEQDLLAQGMPVEMADRDTVVPIVTLVDRPADLEPLLDALVHSIRRRSTGIPREPAGHVWDPAEQVRTPREAFFAPHVTVDRASAAGRICAEVVAPYPPGVPVLVPGERIDRDTLDRLAALAATGTRVAYAADPALETIQVLA